MRIAVPLSGGVFSQHFGQSSAFWVCDVEQEPLVIVRSREIPVPEGGGCGVIPEMLAREGVHLVIAGGIGMGAVQNLARCGINAVRGVAGGTPEQLVKDYLAGRLTCTGGRCEHHGDHEHGHGHGHGGCCHGHE